MSWRVMSRKTDQTERAARSGKLDDESTAKLNRYLAIQRFGNWGFKASVVPFLYGLYKKNYFKGKTPFMIREIVTVIAMTGYCYVGEFALNELMWAKTRLDVAKYGKLKKMEYTSLSRNVVEVKSRSQEEDLSDLLNEE